MKRVGTKIQSLIRAASPTIDPASLKGYLKSDFPTHGEMLQSRQRLTGFQPEWQHQPMAHYDSNRGAGLSSTGHFRGVDNSGNAPTAFTEAFKSIDITAKSYPKDHTVYSYSRYCPPACTTATDSAIIDCCADQARNRKARQRFHRSRSACHSNE